MHGSALRAVMESRQATAKKLSTLVGSVAKRSNQNPAWYVVYCHAKQEFRAKLGLGALGFQVYVPVEKRWIRHARKREIRERPLFSRYIFVSFDVSEPGRLSSIVTTDGVLHILANPLIRGNEVTWIPEAVPEAFIAHLRRKEAAGDFDYTKPTCAFSIGQEVRIAEGPFAGLNAIVHSTPDNKKVEVLLDLLKRKTVVELEASGLEKV